MKPQSPKLTFDKTVSINLDSLQFTSQLDVNRHNPNTTDGTPYAFRDYFTVNDVDYNSCPKHTIRRVPECNNIPVMYLMTKDLDQLLNHKLFADIDPTCIRTGGPITIKDKPAQDGGVVTAVWGSKGILHLEDAYKSALANYLVNESYKDSATEQCIPGIIHGGEMWEFIEGYDDLVANNPRVIEEDKIALTNQLLEQQDQKFRVTCLLDPSRGTWSHWRGVLTDN